MKKVITFLALVFFIVKAEAQTCQGPPILYEDFNSGIPNTWTVLNFDTCTQFFNMPIKGYTGAWQAYEHYGRQGVADADRYANPCSANDYLITPQITLGSAPVCLSWWGSTMYSTYTENYEILISTTTPDSTGFKANPPLAVITNEIPTWTAHSVDLSSYAGQTVYIAFWNNNNTYNGYALYIDDIRVSQPVSLDASVTSVVFPDVIVPSSQVVSGQLLNGGLTNLTSFTLNWKVGSGPVNSMPVLSVNVAPSSFYSFTHSINWVPSANGTYAVKVWASNLNGANDMYHANDTLTQIVFVNTFPRKPLVEEFTQASCPPCAAYNPGVDAVVQPNITSGAISSVKYHTVWPGVDPMNVYNQAEVAQRVLYYGVGGVPSVLVDGVFIPDNCNAYPGSAACFAQQNIDSAKLVPSIFDIKITEAKTASVFNATVTLTAKTDVPFTSFSLYTVIMEDTVVYASAPGTNGETTFPQVARKMLPDSLGYPISPMTNNQVMTYTCSYAPNTTTCNMNELHMVAFVSDDATRHVYQSENTSLGVTSGIQHMIGNSIQAVIYPNPGNGIFIIKVNEHENTTVEIYNTIGQKVLNQTLQTNITQLNLSDCSNGIYQVKLVKGNNSVYQTKLIKQD